MYVIKTIHPYLKEQEKAQVNKFSFHKLTQRNDEFRDKNGNHIVYVFFLSFLCMYTMKHLKPIYTFPRLHIT